MDIYTARKFKDISKELACLNKKINGFNNNNNYTQYTAGQNITISNNEISLAEEIIVKNININRKDSEENICQPKTGNGSTGVTQKEMCETIKKFNNIV